MSTPSGPISDAASNSVFVFNNDKHYNFLKWVALIVLPALATLWLTIATLWHLSDGAEVSGTIMAVDTFLGVILGVSSSKFNNLGGNTVGQVVVDKNNPQEASFLMLNKTPEDIIKKDSIQFKVVQQDYTPQHQQNG